MKPRLPTFHWPYPAWDDQRCRETATFDLLYNYALDRMARVTVYDRGREITSNLPREDIATMYAMAAVLDDQWRGSFWIWARNAGLR